MLPVPVSVAVILVVGGLASGSLGMLLAFTGARVDVGEVGLVGFGQVPQLESDPGSRGRFRRLLLARPSLRPDNSVAVLLRYGYRSVLLAGDAEAAEGFRRRPFVRGHAYLNSAEGAEAPIYWHDDAGHEPRGRRTQPDQGPHQFLRIAKAPRRGVLDDGLSPLGQAPVLVHQQCPVLLAEEEARGYGVYPQTRTVFVSQLDS